MIREHHFQQLPVETIRTRLDLRQVETRLKIEIVGDRAMLKVEATRQVEASRASHRCRIIAVCTVSVVTPGTADCRQKCVDSVSVASAPHQRPPGHACAGTDQIDRPDRLHQKITPEVSPARRPAGNDRA
jgi:hypothetical protein